MPSFSSTALAADRMRSLVMRTLYTELCTLYTTFSLLCYAVVPDADHLMMFPVNENMEDADPKNLATETPQSPAYFAMLASWLESTAFASQPKPTCFHQGMGTAVNAGT